MNNSVIDFGFGIVPTLVMKDKNLSIEAKAIYSYLCTHANSYRKTSVEVDLMIEELCVSRARFFKYRKELVNRGYIIIETRRFKNRADTNIYILNNFIGGKENV